MFLFQYKLSWLCAKIISIIDRIFDKIYEEEDSDGMTDLVSVSDNIRLSVGQRNNYKLNEVKSSLMT